MDNYEEYMVQIVKLLGYNCANVTEEVKEIVEFEKTLAKVSKQLCFLYTSYWIGFYKSQEQ